ncbi:MAG: hypothetical protein K0R45_2673 [Pseudomonas sp.]|nr:hypothetical protein [Pseudomonas sp.]
MFAKMTKALLLTGCLIGAGTAAASDRSVVVPVLAGAAVGAVLATVVAKSGNDHHHRAPRHVDYRPRYQPVAYVPVAPPPRYYRAPAPQHFHHRGPDRGRYDNHGHRGYQDHRRW